MGAGCNEGREVAALCIYHDQDCDGRLLVDLMRTHRRVLINNAILESPYFEPPDQTGIAGTADRRLPSHR